jgi:diguanylate cyclase (GGDEF)-like protein
VEGISVFRVTALPALGLAISVGAAVASIGTATSARSEKASVAKEQSRFAAVAPIQSVRVAGFEAYSQFWNREVNQKADIEGSISRLQSALSDPALDKQPAIVSAREQFKAIATAASPKDQMGLLGKIGDYAESATTDVLEPLGGRVGVLRFASGSLWTIHGLTQLTAAQRIAAGVDPKPIEPDLVAYIDGYVAGTSVDPTDNFEKALLKEVSSATLRSELKAVLADPRTKPFADDVNWTLHGAKSNVRHPSYGDFERSRQVTMKLTGRSYSNEVRRIKRGFDRQVASLNSEFQRSRDTSWAAALCALGSLLWLFGRLGSRLRAMRTLAETDSLTGALNRTGIRRVVDPWFGDRGSKPIALAVIDLDNFKLTNDKYGHLGGDRVLQATSDALHGTTIPNQTSIGRWGGDEFVAVFRLPESSELPSFDRLFERVHTSIAEPISVGDQLVSTTATMGVVVCSCGSCNFDDLFRTADHALYVGKFEGRNRWTSVACDFDLSQRLAETLNPQLITA